MNLLKDWLKLSTFSFVNKSHHRNKFYENNVNTMM
jgi:hypothetical protein